MSNQSSDTHSEEFVALVLDFLFDQPIGNFVDLSTAMDVDQLANLFTNEFRHIVEKPETEEWIYEQVKIVLEESKKTDSSLRDVIPETLIEPTKELVRREYAADPVLIRAMINHPAMRKIVRGVMQNVLMTFIERAEEWMRQSGIPGQKGFTDFFFKMFGMARRFASVIETEIEPRVENFVDDMIDQTVEQIINQLSSEEMSEDFSRWRVDLVDTVLDQPLERYVTEFQKLDPELTIQNIGLVLRSLANSETFDEEFVLLIDRFLDFVETQTLNDFIKNSNYNEVVRSNLKSVLGPVFTDMLESKDFEQWVSAKSN